MNRIIQLDGLRTLAVVGVIWAHTWAFVFSTPPLHIGINWARVIAFFGTGVDLFFVISGFCMYQMYANKQKVFAISNFIEFIKKRWLRIAPAYYLCVMVTGIIAYFDVGVIAWKETIANILFINNMPIPFDAPWLIFHFWSLAVEWQFYMVLPLLIHGIYLYGFNRTITAILLGSLLIRFCCFYFFPETESLWILQIFNKFSGFGFGIIVAKLYANNYPVPKILSGSIGFILALAIAYMGRIGMTTEIRNLSGDFLPLLNTINEPLLSLGYAFMVWNIISTPSIFSTFFSTKVMTYLGKISYSIYLWHWIICAHIGGLIAKHLGQSFWANQIGFVIIMLITTFVAHFSYQWFEAFYFQKKK